MPNAPTTQNADLSRDPDRMYVNLGPIGGALGEIEVYDSEKFRLVSWSRWSGGRMEIQFEYDLAKAEESLVDMEFWSGNGQLVEIVRAMPSGVMDKLMAWGAIFDQEPEVSEDQEKVRITARVADIHFGSELQGMHFVNHADPDPGQQDSDPLISEGPIVFNPLIDGEVCGNMASPLCVVRKEYGNTDPDAETMELRLFLDPESVRTTEAQVYLQRDHQPMKGMLLDAVHTLCWLCNPMEKYFKNPTRLELAAVFNEEEDFLKNVVLPPGQYLPYYLTELLTPRGYAWFVLPTQNQDSNSPDYGSTELRMQFFKLGEGVVKTIHQPRPGETLIPGGKQKALTWSLRESFDELRNKSVAAGGILEREITIELRMGWDPAFDNLTADELSRDGELYLTHRNVWRNWIGNEAGDYIATRPSITEAPDLPGMFGTNSRYRRRPMGDCLTKLGSDTTNPNKGENRRRQPFLEYTRNMGSEEKEVVKFQLFGNPDDYEITIHWMDGSTEKEIGPYDPTGVAPTNSTLIADMTAEGVTGISDGSGVVATGLSIKFEPGEVAPDFWVEGTFTGGIKPGLAVTSNRWAPIPEGWNPMLLRDELGVFFNSDTAVEELIKLGTGVRIRMTGTVEGDTRLKATAEKEDSSPLEEEYAIYTDVSDRFYHRKVQRTGPFMSRLIGVNQTPTDAGTDEKDDTEPIGEFAERIRKVEDAVNIQGPIKLFGIVDDYEIGDLVKKIEGRSVSLNRKATDSGLTQYVQISGITCNYHDQQETIIYLGSFDQSEAEQRSQERRNVKRGKRPGT